jgi:hypothetical protein
MSNWAGRRPQRLSSHPTREGRPRLPCAIGQFNYIPNTYRNKAETYLDFYIDKLGSVEPPTSGGMVANTDAVTVRDELHTIPTIIGLARRARGIVTINLAIASAFITVLVLWDLFGHLPLPVGVAGHEGSTIIVALNGMRLLTNRSWRVAAATTR